jgi:hypothetical protein
MTRALAFTKASIRRAGVQAAEFVGVSPSLFDVLVKDGRMPPPKRVNSRTIWDRRQLERAFDALPSEEYCNPWDEIVASPRVH